MFTINTRSALQSFISASSIFVESVRRHGRLTLDAVLESAEDARKGAELHSKLDAVLADILEMSRRPPVAHLGKGDGRAYLDVWNRQRWHSYYARILCECCYAEGLAEDCMKFGDERSLKAVRRSEIILGKVRGYVEQVEREFNAALMPQNFTDEELSALGFNPEALRKSQARRAALARTA